MGKTQPRPHARCFRVDTESLSAPGPNYICGECGAAGVKLWREYQAMASVTNLFCASCACKAENWLVPAVPTAEGDTFWGYTSVPAADVDWWRRLPTRPGR